MNIGKYLLVALIVFLVDLPWLILGSNGSKALIKDIQGRELKVKYLPSLVVYLALAYLAMLPTNAYDAFYLGIATYAVYDFTNLATLTNYTLQFAIMDSIWGGTLFAIVFTILQKLE